MSTIAAWFSVFGYKYYNVIFACEKVVMDLDHIVDVKIVSLFDSVEHRFFGNIFVIVLALAIAIFLFIDAFRASFSENSKEKSSGWISVSLFICLYKCHWVGHLFFLTAHHYRFLIFRVSYQLRRCFIYLSLLCFRVLITENKYSSESDFSTISIGKTGIGTLDNASALALIFLAL